MPTFTLPAVSLLDRLGSLLTANSLRARRAGKAVSIYLISNVLSSLRLAICGAVAIFLPAFPVEQGGNIDRRLALSPLVSRTFTGREPVLLRLAYAFEQATQARHPPPGVPPLERQSN